MREGWTELVYVVATLVSNCEQFSSFVLTYAFVFEVVMHSGARGHLVSA